MKKFTTLFVYLLFFSCTKEVLVDVPPQLEIIVVDLDGNTISDALVKLYFNEKDWNFDENAVIEKRTGDSGSILFEDLKEQVYFIYAEKESKNNRHGVATFDQALQVNKLLKLNIEIK